MKKVVIQAAVVGLVLFAGQFAGTARAEDPADRFSLTASAAVVSEYYFRRISQSLSTDDIKPAFPPGVEAGFKINATVSAYAGLWGRSEERRVGKECVRTGRSRGSPQH